MACAVCTLEFEEGEIRLDLECGHMMHQDCCRRLCKLRNWEASVTCPTCRCICAPAVHVAAQKEVPATQPSQAGPMHLEAERSPGTQDLPNSQLSTPHDEHIVQDADFGFSLPDATVAAALKSDRDPAEAFCDKVMSAETIQEFAKATFPPDLFDGFSDEATIEKTMHNLLDAMVADKRTHRELAMRYDFSISGMAPLPHIEAAKALCLKNGLHPETFLLLIHSNLTWLEHPTSRLGSDPPPPGLDVLATILEPEPQDDLSDILDEKSARKKARRAKHTSQPEQQQAEQDSHSFEEAAAAFVKSTTHNTLAEYLAAAATHFGRPMLDNEQKVVRAAVLEHMAELELKKPMDAAAPQVPLELNLKPSCHTIGTDKAVMAAGSASARKSFMSELTNAPWRCMGASFDFFDNMFRS